MALRLGFAKEEAFKGDLMITVYALTLVALLIVLLKTHQRLKAVQVLHAGDKVVIKKLTDDCARYKKALEYYSVHQDMPLANDGGETAQKALGLY